MSHHIPTPRRQRPQETFGEHDIEPFPGGMIPISWPFVPIEIDVWLNEVGSAEGPIWNFPEELARVHCRFEQTHPFLDGNGRAGRLVLNLILVRLGYPPAIIYKRQRSQYLRALRRADAGDAGFLGEVIARAIGQPLQLHRPPGRCTRRGARPSRGTRNDRPVSPSAACRSEARSPSSHSWTRWAVAKQPELGERLHRPALPTLGLSDLGSVVPSVDG